MPYPHQYITLTPEEREKIKRELERLTRLRKWKKRKPLQALYLSNERKPFRDIADYLKVDYRTVRRWISQYRKMGISSFLPVNNNKVR